MQGTTAKLIVGLAVAVALVLVASSRVSAGRVDCARVVAEIDHITGRPGRYRADPSRIAAKLGVELAWVYKCANVYGRRLSRPQAIRDGVGESLDEYWEAEEPEERGPEEVGEDGQPLTMPEPEPRRRRRAMPPTPTFEDEFNQGRF